MDSKFVLIFTSIIISFSRLYPALSYCHNVCQKFPIALFNNRFETIYNQKHIFSPIIITIFLLIFIFSIIIIIFFFALFLFSQLFISHPLPLTLARHSAKVIVSTNYGRYVSSIVPLSAIHACLNEEGG